jgi:hypothetical protein
MPAPLRITLTEEEDRTLSELRQAQSVPYRTRDRAHMLRLNAQGMNVPAIARSFSVINRPFEPPSNGGNSMASVACGKRLGGVPKPSGNLPTWTI